jgi:CubicO group peptidase (beta-lactamase class C family)
MYVLPDVYHFALKLSRMKMFSKVLIGLVLTLLIAFFLAPAYLRKALIYTTADIDDYTIFANRKIKTGVYQPWQVNKIGASKQINAKYLSRMEELETVAFLVVQDTAIIYEQFWDGYNENSLSNSFSVAKSIISLLVGIAIDEGKIKSVDQKAGEFFPEFAQGENAQLTIKDLLTMSSGLNWDESYASPFSVTTQAYYGDDLKTLILNLKVTQKPGVYFEYLSGNTQLLAFILEKATGMNVSDYATQKLWQPLGAKNDALWSLDAINGEEKAYCCFNSNVRDFARLGQLILNKGTWKGRQLISQTYIEAATTPASYLKGHNGSAVDFYGYQWWILQHKGMQIPYARGILGQYIFVIPDKNAVVVRLGHERSNERIGSHTADVFLYIDAALEILK